MDSEERFKKQLIVSIISMILLSVGIYFTVNFLNSRKEKIHQEKLVECAKECVNIIRSSNDLYSELNDFVSEFSHLLYDERKMYRGAIEDLTIESARYISHQNLDDYLSAVRELKEEQLKEFDKYFDNKMDKFNSKLNENRKNLNESWENLNEIETRLINEKKITQEFLKIFYEYVDKFKILEGLDVANLFNDTREKYKKTFENICLKSALYISPQNIADYTSTIHKIQKERFEEFDKYVDKYIANVQKEIMSKKKEFGSKIMEIRKNIKVIEER